ncbi:hypothetical protein [Paenibacillus roseipurpureus]|uniref:Uncharacterized protein n=1 Tax=Paenibacillus roseopurpureus TaxID=2918901 RepID=A0AA96LNV0_9BACL|nr:hypothetical protein [Paenibacillus sp. MBLB1832]WNR45195.1 hypothetical protein MJB10_03390 [Paenibacillus sp. MBLB1832]
MEYVKVPNYPVMPMPMPTPMPAPMPTPLPAPAPIMQQPAHDIHLHASYQQTQFIYPKPVHTAAVVAHTPNMSAASILVLFILLVIITRGICKY